MELTYPHKRRQRVVIIHVRAKACLKGCKPHIVKIVTPLGVALCVQGGTIPKTLQIRTHTYGGVYNVIRYPPIALIE